jgi:hypothetical protein
MANTARGPDAETLINAKILPVGTRRFKREDTTPQEMVLFATRHIRPGEEILVDYHWHGQNKMLLSGNKK